MKNKILWGITMTAIMLILLMLSSLEQPTLLAGIIIAVCSIWLLLFIGVNWEYLNKKM